MKALLRLTAIMRKEVRQLLRDRLTIGMIIGIPMIQLALFGYAINTDVRHLRAAVADEARSHLARQFVADLEASQVIDLVAAVANPQELMESIRAGRIAVGVHVHPDFDRRVIDGREAAVQVLVDGTDPTILQVANQLTAMTARFDTQPVRPAVRQIEVRNFYNPERRSAVAIVPGLTGVILTMTMVLFTAVAIVRERERGNLELLIATPVATGELMVGKIVPYVIIGLIQLSLVLLVADLLFRVPLIGNLGDVYLAALVFIVANLSLGLTISTFVQTQFQAMQMAFFVFLPSILLSGFMFPFRAMPGWAQAIGEALPITHFLRIVREVVLKHAGFADIIGDLWPLTLILVVLATLALMRFRRTLD